MYFLTFKNSIYRIYCLLSIINLRGLNIFKKLGSIILYNLYSIYQLSMNNQDGFKVFDVKISSVDL